MTCPTCREAVSAALDGEAPPVDEQQVATHLDGCADCRSFARRAETLHRRVRVSAADDVPDLSIPVLLAVPPHRSPVRRQRPQLRSLLVLLAAAQTAVAIAGLLGTGHLGRDLAVFDLALGVGFLLAAWKPDRAAGLLPLVAVLAVFDLLVGITNVVAGAATVVGELPHLLPLMAVVVLHLFGPPSHAHDTARVELR